MNITTIDSQQLSLMIIILYVPIVSSSDRMGHSTKKSNSFKLWFFVFICFKLSNYAFTPQKGAKIIFISICLKMFRKMSPSFFISQLECNTQCPTSNHGRPQGRARGGPWPPWPAKIVCFLTFLEENSMFLGVFR